MQSPMVREASLQESKRIIFKPKEVIVENSSVQRKSRVGDDSLLEISLLESRSPTRLPTKYADQTKNHKYMRLSHDKIEELK